MLRIQTNKNLTILVGVSSHGVSLTSKMEQNMTGALRKNLLKNFLANTLRIYSENFLLECNIHSKFEAVFSFYDMNSNINESKTFIFIS